MVVLNLRPDVASAPAATSPLASRGASHASARRRLLGAAIAGCIVALPACTTLSVQPAPALDRAGTWALLPIVNQTETPQAGLRAESILESLLRTGGVASLRRYPAAVGADALFDSAERRTQEQAQAWARGEGLRYGLSGTVDEWRYKVGVDGEPAIGITLQLTDLSTGSVVWTATGSKTGWSREGLSAVAQKLLAELTAPLIAGRAAGPR